MKIKLKGKALYTHSRTGSVHQFALQSQVSAMTAYKYVNGEVKSVDLETLAKLLTGAGYTAADAANLRLGDLLEISD